MANLTVHHHHVPEREKTAIRKMYEKLTHPVANFVTKAQQAVGMSRTVAIKGTHALRATGEAAIVGGLLGVADAKLGGLDANIAIGDGMKVPLDGAGGAVAMLASIVPALDVVHEDLKTVGIIGVASYAQRQAKEWASNAGGAVAPSGQHGEFGEDKVLEWAANVDR